jgi:hypothetical protein
MESKDQLATSLPDNILGNKNKLILYKNMILNFKPVTVELHEFNPLVNPKVSVPCLVLSMMSVGFYRIKYLLVKAKIIRISSLFLNYSLMYYLATNAVSFYEHSKKFEQSV